MLLLLIRHANAGDRDPERWPDDRDRPLTDKGRKTQRDVSRFLLKRDFVPTLVLTSPWARAAETAEILVRELQLAEPAGPVRCAGRRARPRAPGGAIGEPGPDGHRRAGGPLAVDGGAGEPAAHRKADGVRIDYPKSGVMGIDVEKPEAGAGELRFFLRPKMV